MTFRIKVQTWDSVKINVYIERGNDDEWYTVVYSGIQWYTVVYSGIQWYMIII